MCANDKVHCDPMVVSVCFNNTQLHYYHYADISESIELLECQVHPASSVCLTLSQLPQLSFMQYIGLCVFSVSISLMMIVRICVLYLIIIIKSEVWSICHCLRLRHETMVCAECLLIFYHVYLSRGHTITSNSCISLMLWTLDKWERLLNHQFQQVSHGGAAGCLQ